MSSDSKTTPPGQLADGAPPATASTKVVTAGKKPPPESSESVWTRRSIILASWLLVVFVGLPLWWRTTTVYRAPLPLSDMISWAEGSMCRPSMRMDVRLDAPSLETAQRSSLAQAMELGLRSANDKSGLSIFSFHVAEGLELSDSTPAMTVALAPSKNVKEPSAKLSPYATQPLLQVSFTDGKYANQKHQIEQLVVQSLDGLFADERAMTAHLLSSTPSLSASSSSYINNDVSLIQELEQRRTRSMRYATTYHLTFSLFTPEAQPSDWEIEKALAETIEPLLAALAPISNFTVDTQVQPYAVFSPSVQPSYDEDRKAWQLRSTDLGGFINAAEWPLSPSIGEGPTINFVLYVPAASQTPLLVEDRESTSWLIRQWGGIAIYNAKSPEKLQQRGTLTADEMRGPLLTFSQHLLDLLGMPSSEWPFQQRLSVQRRLLGLRLITSASSTLGSLARLTEELPSISVPESVAVAATATTAHLESACAALKEGRFQQALEHARTADAEVEKAFFHKSMVGQVYFPDEHKVAVYLPMLGPMAVPLLMTALSEAKAIRQAFRR